MIDTRNNADYIALKPQPVLVTIYGQDRWRWNPKRGRLRAWLWPKDREGVVATHIHLDCPWPAKTRAGIRRHMKTCPWTIRVLRTDWGARIWFWVHANATKEKLCPTS